MPLLEKMFSCWNFRSSTEEKGGNACIFPTFIINDKVLHKNVNQNLRVVFANGSPPKGRAGLHVWHRQGTPEGTFPSF
jgi:hypothetical protein